MIRYDVWEGLMDPDEFDQRGAARRDAKERWSAGTVIVGLGALLLWAYIVVAVAWGIATSSN